MYNYLVLYTGEEITVSEEIDESFLPSREPESVSNNVDTVCIRYSTSQKLTNEEAISATRDAAVATLDRRIANYESLLTKANKLKGKALI